MASGDSEPVLMPSILDRLIDPSASGQVLRRGYSLRQIVEAVRRDLEDLLNTRAASTKPLADFVELRHSTFAYGIPDFSSVETSTHNDRQRLAELIEKIVERFEPRLRAVQAVLIDQGTDARRSITFNIAGRLAVDPAPEVSFETVLELASGHTVVRRRDA